MFFTQNVRNSVSVVPSTGALIQGSNRYYRVRVKVALINLPDGLSSGIAVIARHLIRS